MVQTAFCDLSHTFNEHVTNVSQHIFSLYYGESPLTYVGRRALTASLSGVEWMLTRWPPSVTQASSASCHVLRVGQYLTHPREEGRDVYPDGQPGDTEMMGCLLQRGIDIARLQVKHCSKESLHII